MGVYSINATDNIDYMLESMEVECPHDFGSEGSAAIIAEAEENYGRIMKAVGIQELAAFEMTGQEMVYESADVKGFFAKIKQFFMNILKKIQMLFTKFFAAMDALIKGDKEFVSKYKAKILAGSVKGLKYKGFKFSVDNMKFPESEVENIIPSELNAAVSTAMTTEKYANAIEAGKNKEDDFEKMRAKAVGENGSMTVAEYNKALFEKFRSGESTKEELDNISASDQLGYITGTEAAKKSANNAFKEIKNRINVIIKDFEKIEKETLRNVGSTESKGEEYGTDTNKKTLNASDKLKVVSDLLAYRKQEIAIAETFNGALLTALKDRNRQAKAICVKLIGRKATNESYGFEEDCHVFGEGGFLDSVTIK